MITSGILDKTRLISNVLMVGLLAGNIYLATQFIENIKKPVLEDQTNITMQIKSARFLKTFINTVLNNAGTVSIEDRVQMENEVLQMHDSILTTNWNEFVASKTAKEAQTNAVKLMVLLVDRV